MSDVCSMGGAFQEKLEGQNATMIDSQMIEIVNKGNSAQDPDIAYNEHSEDTASLLLAAWIPGAVM